MLQPVRIRKADILFVSAEQPENEIRIKTALIKKTDSFAPALIAQNKEFLIFQKLIFFCIMPFFHV